MLRFKSLYQQRRILLKALTRELFPNILVHRHKRKIRKAENDDEANRAFSQKNTERAVISEENMFFQWLELYVN